MLMVSSFKFSSLSDMINFLGCMFLWFFVILLMIVEFSFMWDNEFVKEGKFCESSIRVRRGSSESEMRCVVCKFKFLIFYNFRGVFEVSFDFLIIVLWNVCRLLILFGYFFVNVVKLNFDTFSFASSSSSGVDASLFVLVFLVLILLLLIVLYFIFFIVSLILNLVRCKLVLLDVSNVAYEFFFVYVVSNSIGFKM